MHHDHTVPVLAMLLAASFAPAHAQITIDNLTNGDVLRQAAVLLRGRCATASEVTVETSDGREVYRASVVGGRFLALVELPPGRHGFTLRAGAERATLTLEHRPSTSMHRVRVVYIVAADGRTDYMTQRAKDPQNYRDKLDAVAKCLQAFTAEAMRDAGFGRTTFQLESDRDGRVVVHTLKHTASRRELQKLEGNAVWSAMANFVGKQFDGTKDKLLVVTAFSGYDPSTRKTTAATALGGGSVGVFSNLCMFSWPDSLADVPRAFTDATSVDTGKVSNDIGLPDCYHLASTTVGAMLHEMGHTFGLPHTSDPRCIMSRGFDFLHRALVPGEPAAGGMQPHAADTAAWWSPAFALRLAHSPWFLPDPAPPPRAGAPRYSTADGGARITAVAEAGLAGWSVHSGGTDPTRAVATPAAEDASYTLTFDFDELRRQHEMIGPLTILLYDRAHRLLRIEENRVRNSLGYLRRWQLGVPAAWDRKPPPLPGASKLQQWRLGLARAEEKEVSPTDSSSFQSVDLLERLGGSDQHVLLRTTVRRKDAGRSTLLFGGDDGARIWVNGKLVFDRVELEVFATDSVRLPVELEAGENEVLVQSFQGGGGWGVSLRFEEIR